MKHSNKKIVSISNWYYVLRLLISLSAFILSFIFFWMIFTVTFTQNDQLILTLSTVFSGILSIVFLIGYSLYWKQSGIYVTKDGDHIVKWGGWVAKEDKLLNGVIIANQVERGPLDQILGMATLTLGTFANRKLVGVRYADIKKYDDLMRSGNPNRFTSII